MRVLTGSQFTVKKGQLVEKSQVEKENKEKVIGYAHTLRAQPDQYYTDAIREYKKEIDYLKKNYSQLQKAYWGLLGYKPEGEGELDGTFFSPMQHRDKSIYLNSTIGEESAQGHHQVSITGFQLGQCLEVEEQRKKIAQLSESAIVQNSKVSLWTGELANMSALGSNSHCKLQEEENDEQMSEKLCAAFKQIAELKDKLENSEQDSTHKAQQIRKDYEQHIKKLQEILQRERKNTRMLNGVINRLRGQLNSKDTAIRNLMDLKNTDKASLDKLIKQLKVKKV